MLCPLNKCAGRNLAEDIVADRPLPPFDRVMMDGYAVKWSPRVSQYQIRESTYAGVSPGHLHADENAAFEVMTGAALPEGADTVIPYEDTIQINDGFSVLDTNSVEAGQFIHRKSSDYAEGTVLLKAGTRMGPVEAGIAASCGYAQLSVYILPRIAVIGTGDELVPVNETPAPHQIRQSNVHAIETALNLAGFPARFVGHLQDDPEGGFAKLAEVVESSDIVIITGAVSMGRRDWVPDALNKLGEKVFHGVAQKPGKPMGFWMTSRGSSVFALPGNPVSALVGLHRYVLPFLHARTTNADLPEFAPVKLTCDWPAHPSLTLFVPGYHQQSQLFKPAPVRNSGDFARLAGTEGFVEIPPAENGNKMTGTFNFIPWQ